MRLKEHSIVLLQGDSITDAGRSRTNDDELGHGYAGMLSAWVSAAWPGQQIRFLNRGISGNRAKDLRARWKPDCLDLRPDWVSIMIGINDTWRRYDSADPTSAQAFEASYRSILEDARDKLDAQLVLCEPFLLPVPPDRRAWRVDLDPKIAAVRELAREFGAILVPLDGVFAQASTRREPAFWAPDGVHPTPAGHALIAQAWLKAVLGSFG